MPRLCLSFFDIGIYRIREALPLHTGDRFTHSQRFWISLEIITIKAGIIDYTNTDEYLAEHQERDEFSIENGLARHLSYNYAQLEKYNCTEEGLTNYLFRFGSFPLKKLFFQEFKKHLKDRGDKNDTFEKLKELIEWRYTCIF